MDLLHKFFLSIVLNLNFITILQCREYLGLTLDIYRKVLLRPMRLNGGCRAVSIRDRWESAGFSLQPDFGPEAHPDVPLEHKLGDAAEYGDHNALTRLIQVRFFFLTDYVPK